MQQLCEVALAQSSESLTQNLYKNYFVNVEVQIPAENIIFFLEDFFFLFLLLLLPKLIMLHLFLTVYFVCIYNHKIITQDCLVTVFI